MFVIRSSVVSSWRQGRQKLEYHVFVDAWRAVIRVEDVFQVGAVFPIVSVCGCNAYRFLW